MSMYSIKALSRSPYLKEVRKTITVYSIHPTSINSGKYKILIKLIYAWIKNVISYLMLQNLSLKPFGKFRIKGKNF